MAKTYSNLNFKSNMTSGVTSLFAIIAGNGTYSGVAAGYLHENAMHTVTIEPEMGTLAGSIAFSVNGDPGIGENVLDLATDRVRNFQGRVPYIDFTVEGLPVGSSFNLYIS